MKCDPKSAKPKTKNYEKLKVTKTKCDPKQKSQQQQKWPTISYTKLPKPNTI